MIGEGERSMVARRMLLNRVDRFRMDERGEEF